MPNAVLRGFQGAQSRLEARLGQRGGPSGRRTAEPPVADESDHAARSGGAGAANEGGSAECVGSAEGVGGVSARTEGGCALLRYWMVREMIDYGR